MAPTLLWVFLHVPAVTGGVTSGLEAMHDLGFIPRATTISATPPR